MYKITCYSKSVHVFSIYSHLPPICTNNGNQWHGEYKYLGENSLTF